MKTKSLVSGIVYHRHPLFLPDLLYLAFRNLNKVLVSLLNDIHLHL